MTGERTIASGKARLAAWTAGQGAPVVFLHAGVADSRMWGGVFDSAARGHQAIAYDRRGFGKTQTATEAFSSVGDLLRVLDETAPGQAAVLVGCSQGGKVALDAALTHPERVHGLVLIAPSVSGAPPAAHPPAIAQLLEDLDAAEDEGDLERVNRIEARLWLDGPLAAEGRVQGEARRLFLEMNGIALGAGDAGTDSDAVGAFGRLAEVFAPCLVAWGDLDFPHIQERCRHLARAIPSAQARGFAGMAHLPSLEEPETIALTIGEFLA